MVNIGCLIRATQGDFQNVTQVSEHDNPADKKIAILHHLLLFILPNLNDLGMRSWPIPCKTCIFFGVISPSDQGLPSACMLFQTWFCSLTLLWLALWSAGHFYKPNFKVWGFAAFKKLVLRARSVSYQRNIPIALKSNFSLPLHVYQKELETLQGRKMLIHCCLPA